MPKKRRSFSQQRTSSKNLQRNILIAIGGIIGVVAFVAILANQSAPIDKSFPAREAGASLARVLVEEYSDFQSPVCRLFATAAEVRLREEYIKPGKIRFIYRNFPIVDTYAAGATESHLSALAALCAGDQDMFWEYHDLLFQNQSGENQGNFSVGRLQAFASQLYLDGTQFNKCLSGQDHLDILNADIQRANVLRLSEAPAFFVNGVIVYANPPDFEELFTAIDRELPDSGG